jgi:hypothetical protein
MACSKRKRARPAPAADLYDGSAYRVLKKRNVGFWRVPVLILSAEHGLISSTRVIAPYDLKMDGDRAAELSENYVVEQARALVRGLPGWPFGMIFCHGGSLYRQVLRGYEEAGVFGKAAVSYSSGAIGEQLAQLVKFFENQR